MKTILLKLDDYIADAITITTVGLNDGRVCMVTNAFNPAKGDCIIIHKDGTSAQLQRR